MTGPGVRHNLPGMSDDSDLTRGPKALLMDTVARLQLEVEAMKSGNVMSSDIRRTDLAVVI